MDVMVLQEDLGENPFPVHIFIIKNKKKNIKFQRLSLSFSSVNQKKRKKYN